MDIHIAGTDKIRSLTALTDNGIDWTADLIEAGNLPHDDDGITIMSQDDFDWWANYISDTEQTESDARKLADDTGMDYSALMMEISAAQGNTDYDGHRAAAVLVMDGYRRNRS